MKNSDVWSFINGLKLASNYVYLLKVNIRILCFNILWSWENFNQTRMLKTFNENRIIQACLTHLPSIPRDATALGRSNRILRRGNSTSATVQIDKPFKLFLLDVGPDTKVTLSREDALKYYKQMFWVRRTEQKCAELYKSRHIRGFCHLYSGQEAGAIGMKAAMRDVDTIITSYRCHPWIFLQGGTTEELLAELCGRVTGNSRGKGGSMHMYCKNFFGGNGIVGAQVPLGVGSAFAHKYKDTKGACFILYGDGAANQGQVFESFNLAKLMNLPAIFVCENNKYGMGTADFRAAANPVFYTRACYIPGIWVNGMDILAVREASRFALAHILAGKGPLVMEFETYRYFGHSMSDPGTSYRTRDEIQKVRESKDPIAKLKAIMLREKLASEDELKKIDKETNASIDKAEAKIKKDPEPGMDEIAADVHIKPIEQDVRGITPFVPFKHKIIGKPLYA